MGNLITLQEFKDYAGISVDTWDNQITALIPGISKMIESYCQRIFGEVKQVTERLDIGESQSKILLYYYPLNSVGSVHDDCAYDENGDLLTGSLLTPNSDYLIYHRIGEITRAAGLFFTEGHQKVQVIYEALSAIVPEDVKLAACRQLSYVWRSAGGGEGKESEKIGDYSYKNSAKLMEDGILGIVKEILAYHRRILT